MDFYGSGHPHGGQLAVSFAMMCNDIVKGCMQEGRLKLAQHLLTRTIHLLRLEHSATSFSENQNAMSVACCNMASLMHKKHVPQEALKWIIRAITIESKIEWLPSHAVSYINCSATYSLLGRHEEALEQAQRAVDMLCKKPGWQLSAVDQDSEAGELLPMAFNNLAVEYEHLGDTEMASQSYGYAADLAAQRWGDKDERTIEIRRHKEEAETGKELENFDYEAASIFYGRKKGRQGKRKPIKVPSQNNCSFQLLWASILS